MNSLYSSFQSQQGKNQSPLNLDSALRDVAQKIAPYGMDPEQFVRQLMQNKQMTQAQFEQYRKIANSLTGKNL